MRAASSVSTTLVWSYLFAGSSLLMNQFDPLVMAM
jgi:hypothetical protein